MKQTIIIFNFENVEKHSTDLRTLTNKCKKLSNAN